MPVSAGWHTASDTDMDLASTDLLASICVLLSSFFFFWMGGVFLQCSASCRRERIIFGCRHPVPAPMDATIALPPRRSSSFASAIGARSEAGITGPGPTTNEPESTPAIPRSFLPTRQSLFFLPLALSSSRSSCASFSRLWPLSYATSNRTRKARKKNWPTILMRSFVGGWQLFLPLTELPPPPLALLSKRFFSYYRLSRFSDEARL